MMHNVEDTLQLFFLKYDEMMRIEIELKAEKADQTVEEIDFNKVRNRVEKGEIVVIMRKCPLKQKSSHNRNSGDNRTKDREYFTHL
jgi:hypothetical protein